MKIYKLTISTPNNNESQRASVIGSYRSDPRATKVEYFKTLELVERRKVELSHLVERINLVPWLVSVSVDEIEVIE